MKKKVPSCLNKVNASLISFITHSFTHSFFSDSSSAASGSDSTSGSLTLPRYA
jgi:hypothetical protein